MHWHGHRGRGRGTRVRGVRGRRHAPARRGGTCTRAPAGTGTRACAPARAPRGAHPRPRPRDRSVMRLPGPVRVPGSMGSSARARRHRAGAQTAGGRRWLSSRRTRSGPAREAQRGSQPRVSPSKTVGRHQGVFVNSVTHSGVAKELPPTNPGKGKRVREPTEGPPREERSSDRGRSPLRPGPEGPPRPEGPRKSLLGN